MECLPKVSKEYFENKRNKVLDAALKICRTKPVYKLTMKDIVNETGLSFGALYDSFSDVDEVIIALFNRLSAETDFSGDIFRILETQKPPEEKLGALFNHYLEHARATISSYGKISYEMSAIITDGKRREKIEAGLQDKGMYINGLEAALNLIRENIANGYFTPVVSKESVCALIIAFFDGLYKDLTLIKCYGIKIPMTQAFEGADLAKALTQSVLRLLQNGRKETE